MAPDLIKEYPNIVGEWSVSNKKREQGQGIGKLRDEIIATAMKLPLMGEEWPTSWFRAAERIRREGDSCRKIPVKRLWEIMDDSETKEKDRKPVPEDDRIVLAKVLHDLGDVLYFDEDEELQDTVILDPHWVTTKISDVLVSEDVEPGHAILTHAAMNKIWKDDEIDTRMCERLLRLMENFDLSYRIPDDEDDRSLIVEKLSEDEPEYNLLWNHQLDLPGCKEISMKFDLGQKKPAGIPTWFIARTHRFTQGIHWLHGALFGDDRQNPKHFALVVAPAGQEHVTITVRGPNPHSFLALLRDGLEVTLDRFKGLKDQIVRTVPCPDPGNEDCKSHFKLADLEKRLALDEPKTKIECPSCIKDVSVTELLFGISHTTDSQVLDRLDALESKLLDSDDQTRDLVDSGFEELRQLSQRQFLTLFNSQQRLPESHTPRVFTLRTAEQEKLVLDINDWAGSRDSVFSKVESLYKNKWQLQLYCESPGCWHPPRDDGVGLFEIKDNKRFFQGIGSGYTMTGLITVLKYAAVTGAAVTAAELAFGFPGMTAMIAADVKFMAAISKVIPSLTRDGDPVNAFRDEDEYRHKIPNEHRGESLSALRKQMLLLEPGFGVGQNVVG